MKIFDSHTHLNSDEFQADIPGYLAQAKRLGVVRLANVGSDTRLNAGAIALAHQYPEMVAVVGWHPENAKDYHDSTEAELENQLADPSVVALGEIGMDYHQNVAPHKIQKTVFERQLALARNLHKPVAIHCRDAFEETYKILKAAHVETFGGVMHSFNGDPEWLAKFLDLGMMISYSGVVSYNSAHDVHASTIQTPLDRMMVETDAPYLAPVPYRGKQNEPANTLYTVEAIARLRNVNPDEIAAATYRNTLTFYGVNDEEN
ncbi:TatD family hydrolase [Levilactobacillus bambusae]|uniref:Hydrolase TatD n=1 Tax=Levilactobacillus bambusae TaxID=2024736 RepID=A0A2V1MW18_9LACO|nr:TatD family hydrolase [Levilactobacillus bambusae]PWF99333.1 hydrolase TatD [Levilactobacillus bambusae]